MPLCQPHAVKVRQKMKKRRGDGERWVRKQDWVRLIVACRGKPLSSPNIIIRFSIRLQPSDSEYRQCCCFSFPFLPHQVQRVFAIQSGYKATRKLYLLLRSQNKSHARQISGAGLPGEWLEARGPQCVLLFEWLHNDYHLLRTVVLCILCCTGALGGFTVFFIINI